MTVHSDAYILEKVETQLLGGSTKFVSVFEAPREFAELEKLSTYQLKRLYQNLVDLEFIAGSPLGDPWGPPAIAEKRDRSYLVQWVKEGIDAARAYYDGRR